MRQAHYRWIGVGVFAAAALPGISCVEVRRMFEEGEPPLVALGAPVRFTELGLLGGGQTSFATAINEAGQIIGGAMTEDQLLRGFVWTEEDGMVDIGTLGGTQARAIDNNNHGQICGVSNLEDDLAPLVAFVFTPGEGMRGLPHLFDGPSNATSINDKGEVSGWSQGLPAEGTARGFPQAVMWTADGEIVSLGTLGGRQSIANEINNNTELAGASNNEDGLGRAFFWSAEEGMIDLGTLGGDLAEADAINDFGEVVGRANKKDGGNRTAFFWSRDTGMIDLGTVSGTGSHGFGINDLRQIVGVSTTAAGETKAMFTTLDGPMVQLLDFGAPTNNDAQDINNAGIVVGEIEIRDGERRAVMWK